MQACEKIFFPRKPSALREQKRLVPNLRILGSENRPEKIIFKTCIIYKEKGT